MVRPLVTAAVLIAAWQALVWATGVPRFILPDPARVAVALWERAGLIGYHALFTMGEILGGLALGVVLGAATALTLSYFRPARRWLMPVLVFSQAIPVFALAPLLVLWLGYGMASKVAMATLIIYFPVTSAFFDGLRRTEPGWLDLARTMGGSRWTTLVRIRLPAALPAFASGLRVATAVAPIGAVVGEWVGASAGLGYLMLHANGRMQVDLMFAALLTLAAIAVALYFAVDALLRRALPWQRDKNPDEERD
ncbi:ABC transporter permease [Skermanella rosea]|uniref:ABC transporter permease n=1 Tax=Skermanella rosea TaxID=1817965 RepID=UPI001E2BF206|nr:ABC transporter permease [Skermanella rosea]UEM05135.1 ABC transporter permease [Skermanella rosea]